MKNGTKLITSCSIRRVGPTAVQAAAKSTDQKLVKIMAMMKNVAVENDLLELKTSLMSEVEANTKVVIA